MKKQPAGDGEITRAFFKHKVYGTLYAVELDAGAPGVLAAAVVTEATACRHTLASVDLSLEEAAGVNGNLADFEVVEPVCVDSKHLLDEIGVQERICQGAEADLAHARSSAKEAAEVLSQERAKLHTLVRDATNPSALPLFDAPDPPAADAPPPQQPSA